MWSWYISTFWTGTVDPPQSDLLANEQLKLYPAGRGFEPTTLMWYHLNIGIKVSTGRHLSSNPTPFSTSEQLTNHCSKWVLMSAHLLQKVTEMTRHKPPWSAVGKVQEEQVSEAIWPSDKLFWRIIPASQLSQALFAHNVHNLKLKPSSKSVWIAAAKWLIDWNVNIHIFIQVAKCFKNS